MRMYCSLKESNCGGRCFLQSFHVGHEAGGWGYCLRTSQHVIKNSVDTGKSSEKRFDVTHKITEHTTFLCISSVKTSSKSLLSMTQCVALVMEIVLCITQRGIGMGKIDDGLPTQYTVRRLKDIVMDTVLLQSIIVAISYTGDK